MSEVKGIRLTYPKTEDGLVQFQKAIDIYEKVGGLISVDWGTNQLVVDESKRRSSNLVESRVPTQVPTDNDTVKVTGPGVFEKNGEIFIVKPNRERTRLYAKKLVETPSDRVTETGEHVSFDFEYARGAIYDLTEADRMDVERGRQLMIRYGRCIVCGKRLKVAESVERGIGPVCIKYFRSLRGR